MNSKGIKTFEDFTSHDEVNNISLWSMACLQNLSFETNIRLGKELEILQNHNPRDGRLDVVALGSGELLVLEAKVNALSMLSDGRFSYQIETYSSECQRNIEQHARESGGESSYNLSILLIVGGKETDVFPHNHPDCTTGQVGNISKIFYDQLIEYNIKFISANALWALATTADILGKKVFWYNILPTIFNEEGTIGLLSGGKVVCKNNTLLVKPIILE
jgi:hypothetical protein